jgi:23S rRNA U2552 (ribose-2'-O)-methylase RlmE/FtsJ
MIEIMSVFKIGQADHAASIRSFHLAEGPGGFIEALANTRDRSDDQYVGMTILDGKSDHNIPAWKKSAQFLSTHPNVFIENGSDGTGNLLSLENFGYCAEKYKSSIDIITADGGFDFSDDFNSQEMTIVKLLFAQICFAVTMQKKNGCFILKVFDCFMQHTVDLLYILSSFYDRVYITKPQTSRYANSEKYIVCKHFNYKTNADFYPYLHRAFSNMIENRGNVLRFLRIPIPTFFLNKLEEYNSIFGQQQIENIQNTIILIENKHKNERIENLLKINIQKSTNWCVKYAVPHYAIIKPPNIFLDDLTHVNKFITPLNGRIIGAL